MQKNSVTAQFIIPNLATMQSLKRIHRKLTEFLIFTAISVCPGLRSNSVCELSIYSSLMLKQKAKRVKRDRTGIFCVNANSLRNVSHKLPKYLFGLSCGINRDSSRSNIREVLSASPKTRTRRADACPLPLKSPQANPRWVAPISFTTIQMNNEKKNTASACFDCVVASASLDDHVRPSMPNSGLYLLQVSIPLKNYKICLPWSSLCLARFSTSRI